MQSSVTMRPSEKAPSSTPLARNLPRRAALLSLATLVLASAGITQAQPAPSPQQSQTSHAAPVQPAATPSTAPQSTAPQSTAPQSTAPPSAAQPSAPPSVPPATPANLLDQPAQPATVENRGGALSVRANNASLAQILHQVARETGMQLDGLAGDERVFGTFGPGNPRDVLVSLLDGTSYNVLMVGDLSNGAPRQLLLTHKTGGAPVNTANAAQPRHRPPDNPDDDSEDAPPDQDAPQPQPDQSQDLQNQQPEEQPPGSPDMPRTPQQMLEQLQQMHQSDQPPEQAPEPPPQ
jgi:hypothetical protein